MHAQAEPRIAKRILCAVVVGKQRYAGLVLNLSAGGLFIQTHAPPRRGANVEVQLSVPDRLEAIPLQATVIWRRVVPPRFRTVAQGGIGLRIRRAGNGYDELLDIVLPGAAAPLRGKHAASTSRARTPAVERSAEPEFRIRARHGKGPRTRVLRLRARGEAQARAEAERRLGPDWRILEVDSI